MSYALRSVWRSVSRRRAGPLLAALQIAIALAVLANAAWIVHLRNARLDTPSGIDETNIFVVSSAAAGAAFSYEAMLRDDLAYIRSLPGVIAASPADAVPFSQVGFSTGVWTNPDQKGPPEMLNALSMDEQGLRALGARLAAGRTFSSTEILPPLTLNNMTDFVPDLIITRSAARALFGARPALGKVVYDSLGRPAMITGITDDLIGTARGGFETAREVAFFPRLPALDDFYYVVRTKPGQRDAIMTEVARHLAGSRPGRVVKFARPLERYKRRMFLNDTNTRAFLLVATALVLAMACFGVYGLMAAQVRGRTRQIGIRRALGARRRDILEEALIEMGLVAVAGIGLGVILSLAASRWLTLHYGLPALGFAYLASGVIVLAFVSQAAAWRPARAASAVAPSIATRTI